MISFSVTQHQNLEVNFLRFSRIWPIINSMLHRCPIKLVQCQRDSTVLVNTFLLVLTIFFSVESCMQLKYFSLEQKQKCSMLNLLLFSAVTAAKWVCMLVNFYKHKEMGSKLFFFFVTLLRENGDFFKIPIVCFNFSRIRLNQNR